MGMDGLMRVLVIALLVLAGSLSGCEEVRMQQLDAEYEAGDLHPNFGRSVSKDTGISRWKKSTVNDPTVGLPRCGRTPPTAPDP
jgi:hypothetical protein